MAYDKSKQHTPYLLDKPLNIIIMKYQFTTEGSKPQTKYHLVKLLSESSMECVWEQTVSTPLNSAEMFQFLSVRMPKGFLFEVRESSKLMPTNGIIGLDSLARILSNIKPLKQKVVISICGERKVYELDADKLETLLKSLE